MTEKLFERIKDLEEEIENIKNKNSLIAKNLRNIFKECKIDKEKKEIISNELKKNIDALVSINIKKSFNNGILAYDEFLKLVSNLQNQFVLCVKLTNNDLKNRYLYRYFVKNFNALFSVKDNILIGIIEKNDLPKIKTLNKIPFFDPDTENVNDIELFKIIFETDEIDLYAMNKIISKFKELSQRPSFKNKHFIEYSLIHNKITDFEMEEIHKKKQKYLSVMEEKYPDLEIKLKSKVNNTPFVLALLEKIDTEMSEIKKSRGIENVVNRMLNFIELKNNKNEIRNMVKFLRNLLKK